MARPLAIALIGAGAFGRRHAEILRADPDCALAGIADPAPEARAFAAQLGVPWFAAAEALLDAVKPEAAIIAAPNALHRACGEACAARRVPMLVEKPIADTVEAGRALLAAARATGTPILVGHHRRHNPILAAAHRAIAAGELGRLVSVAGFFLLRKPEDYFDAAWRREPGGGPVAINLIHDIDALRYLAGEIAEVRAFTAAATRGFAVEDAAAIALRFENGALGTLTASDAAAAPWSWELTAGENPDYPRQDAPCYFLAGETGALALPRLDLWHYPPGGHWKTPLARRRLDAAPGDAYAAQLRHFHAVARGEAPPLASGEEGLRNLAVVEAIHRAARSGQGERIAP